MSLQDDIFDIADILKGKPEAKQFERICAHLYETESENERLRKYERLFAEMRQSLDINGRVQIEISLPETSDKRETD